MALNYVELVQAQPSSIINTIELSNAIFDDIVMSNNVEQDIDSGLIEWNDNILLYAEFNNSIVAGGLMYSSAEDGFLVKRKTENQILWTTIGFIPSQNFQPIVDSNQYVGYYTDITSIPTEKYKYMICPVISNLELSGKESDGYTICETNGLSILDMSAIYYSFLETKIDSINQNSAATVINTINGKYPYTYKLGNSNYVTGTASGLFNPYYIDNCNYFYTDSNEENNMIVKYRKKFREWLCDGHPKIIKYYDGRAFLVAINDTPGDDDSEHHLKNITTFNFTEIGDINSSVDLINSGLIVDNYESYIAIKDNIDPIPYTYTATDNNIFLDNIEKIIDKILD